jgi:hypothetical protein
MIKFSRWIQFNQKIDAINLKTWQSLINKSFF